MYDRRVRLPDLLVSEGVVHAETVVEIFEAQALYGGSFDTNLLELGILDERRLMPYLERVFSLQNRVDVAGDPAREALERLPRRYAEQHRVVPFRLIGRTLDVVCTDPSDLRALDEIGFVTGCRLQVSVATEARVAHLLARGYGVAMPSRLANVLAGKTWLKPLLVRPNRAPRPTPRATTQDIGFGLMPTVSIAGIPDADKVPRTTSPVPPAAAPPRALASSPAPVMEARPPAPIVEMPPPPPTPAPMSPMPAVESRPRAPEESVTEQVLRAEPAGLAPPLADRDRPRTEVELSARLAEISERDEIPAIALAFLAGLPRAVLLRVRKNELAGWDAIGDVRRDAVPDANLPLDRPSIFATVANDVTPYEGPLPRGMVEAAFLDQIGADAWPGACVIVPIRVKGRVVSLLYADSPDRSFGPSARDAVVATARHVAETLVRVILVKKQS